jgi:hypothetical protein
MAESLAGLIGILHRLREAASREELGFVLVNEAIGAAPYRQAALWLEGQGVAAISGVSTNERTTPYVQWLCRVCPALAVALPRGGAVGPSMLAGPDRDEWSDWLPAHGAWLPIPRGTSGSGGGLLVAREEPWSEGEMAVLAEACHAYAHALAVFGGRRLSRRKGRKMLWAAALACALALALPVPMTVLAPAELVPAHPSVIRSPLDGMVEKFHVAPNTLVAEGAALFDLDPTTLAGKLEVAEKTMATAEAEYRLASQQAVFDPSAKARLTILAGRLEEREAEAAYLRALLDRIKVKAPRAGLAVLDDPAEWIGRPVSVGERVMLIADERDTEIEAWLAVGDAVDLIAGMKTTLFLNADPLNPVSAVLRHVGYEAMVRPDSTVAYRLRATLAEAEPRHRLGLKGMARIEAGRVPAVYWLFRRPLAAIRHFLGL